jgi:hypothetical protein
MNYLKTLTLLAACYAFTVNAQTSATLPAYTLQAPPAGNAAHAAIQDITKTTPRSALPPGHSEKPLTIKPAAGKGITTAACGVVTELTLLHRSHKPAMMALVMHAINTGKPVVLKDVKCLGSGKAAASSAALVPETPPPMSQAERCKLPQPNGKMAGC